MVTIQVVLSSFSRRGQQEVKKSPNHFLFHCFLWTVLRLVVVQGQRYMSNDVVNCDEVFSIEKQMNGTIKTLGYPQPYPQKKFCNITLKGDSKHRVILSFQDFYLFHPNGPDHKKHSECDGLDNLRIYDGPDERSKLLGEFCGGHCPPHPMMSSGSHLFLRLTSYTSRLGAKGFLANFSFVSNFGIDSGAQKGKGICEFFYDSMEEKEGRITSPNPGGIYPNNANCTYIFDGTFLERVYLKFHYFDLEGIEPCTERSGSDFLEFTNMPGKDPCPARRCGRFIPQEVVSNGPYFRINFRSNERLSGRGFAASYRFVTDEQLPEWASYLRTNTAKHLQFCSVQAIILNVLLRLFHWTWLA